MHTRNKRFAIFAAIFIISAGVLFFTTTKSAEAAWYDYIPAVFVWKKLIIPAASEGVAAVVVWLLAHLLSFVGWILNLAILIFAWAADPFVVSEIINNEAIKTTWGTVRDICNIAFIMILLFSAFATIFQVDKYNYKKILLWLVIMALLVNFSYPITLFIIDFSNSFMYAVFDYKFGALADAGQIFTTGKTFESLQGILAPEDPTIPQILFCIVFVFILAITILALSFILVIRTMALAIIVILSPIGFVGTIIGKDGGWWNHLFKYAMAGPIIAIVLLISMDLMEAVNQLGVGFTSTSHIAGAQKNDSMLAYLASLTIPIIILWMGIAMAVKGIEGSGMAMGRMQRVARGAGMFFSGAGFARDAYQAYRTRRNQANDDSWARRLGTRLGSQQDRLRGNLPGGRDAQLRYEQDTMARISREAKRHDTANMEVSELRDLIARGNQYEVAAAMQELANQSLATQAELNYMSETFGETSQAFRQMQNKVKAYDPVAAFTNVLGATDWGRITTLARNGKIDVKKLNDNSLGNAQFMGTMFDENAIDNKKIEDIRTGANAALIQGTLRTLAASRTASNAANNNIHMAAFAQTGELVDTGNRTANNDFINHITSNMDKDNSKRMAESFIDNDYVQTSMSENLRPNKVKQIIQNMNNANAQEKTIDFLRDTTRNISSNDNAERLRNIAEHDNDLRNYRA